jgi:hypothetical protein
MAWKPLSDGSYTTPDGRHLLVKLRERKVRGEGPALWWLIDMQHPVEPDHKVACLDARLTEAKRRADRLIAAEQCPDHDPENPSVVPSLQAEAAR